MGIQPRPYQGIAIKSVLRALRKVGRALAVLATGLGKTLTTAWITEQFNAQKTLFLVHNNFILSHAMDEFALVFDKKQVRMAIYNGLEKEGAEDADIVFATWQTMGKALKRWDKKHFGLIVVDEAHHAEAPTFQKVLEYFDAPKLGITATPDRGDGADIRDVFGPEVVNITLEEAIARGWLPRVEYHVMSDESLDEAVLKDILNEIEHGKRFSLRDIDRRVFIKKRDEEIAKIINTYDEKAIVFCSSVPHAERMTQYLDEAQSFHSRKGRDAQDTWNINQATLASLTAGDIRKVCAVNAFNEGVNVPSVGLVAFCRMTAASTVFRQQLGRGLRPGKEKLIVLDFVGNIERILAVLNTMNRIADFHERFVSQGGRQAEGYVRDEFEVSGHGFSFTFSEDIVDLMQIIKSCIVERYPTWQEAAEVAQKLRFTSRRSYDMGYKRDPKLPSNPCDVYPDFPGWGTFLGTERKIRMRNEVYRTLAEASKAAKALGISTSYEYRNEQRYKEDPQLPNDPQTRYPEEWISWNNFLGTDIYPTLEEAVAAIKRLGIRTSSEYSRGGYKKDPRLPARLHKYYPEFSWKNLI